MTKNYSHFSRVELVKKLHKLEGRKKYGLVWDEEKTKEKFEKESENALPVLKEVKGKTITTSPNEPVHVLIEGDNYHSLSVLNYTHQSKIDVIYIDPPYNTGNRTWKYNNHFVEREDSYRHSKWLTFMKKRLRLAKNLLKDGGIIVATIDDYEVFPFGMLMDEIFGEESRLAIITVLNKKSGRTTDKFFATCHEYYFVYAKNPALAKINLFTLSEDQIKAYKYEDDISHFKWRDFLRTGGFSTPKERPNSFYPIYFNKKTNVISTKPFKNAEKILPIDSKGNERVWRQTIPSLDKLINHGDIKITTNRAGKYCVKIKDRVKAGLKPKTVWDNPRYDAATHGTKLLENILGEAKVFDFPKSLYAVEDALKITCPGKNAVILDFFAGSGTTGHAVLELNKQDQGRRQFILCTNNELNGQEKELRERGLSEKEIQEHGICQNVTYPRLHNVIKGYRDLKRLKVDGLGGNLRYFKAAFVRNSINSDDLKIRITLECTEMLCLREGVYEEVKMKPDYRIFSDGYRIMAIYYSLGRTALSELKKQLDKMEGKKLLYCFTLDPLGLDRSDFEDWRDVDLEPIPQKILDIYEQIYEY